MSQNSHFNCLHDNYFIQGWHIRVSTRFNRNNSIESYGILLIPTLPKYAVLSIYGVTLVIWWNRKDGQRLNSRSFTWNLNVVHSELVLRKMLKLKIEGNEGDEWKRSVKTRLLCRGKKTIYLTVCFDSLPLIFSTFFWALGKLHF